jgi:hypothetical protein
MTSPVRLLTLDGRGTRAFDMHQTPGTRTKRRLSAALVIAACVAMPSTSLAQDDAPTGAPVAVPSAIPFAGPGALAAGTYTGGMQSGFPEQWTITVPDGWEWFYDFLWKDLDGSSDYTRLGGPGEVALGWVRVQDVAADPCAWRDSLAQVGPTVDDIAGALQDRVGTVVSDATAVMLAGHAAKRIELTWDQVADPETCDEGVFREFLSPGEPLDMGQAELATALGPTNGQGDVMYVLDLAGAPWLLWTWHAADAAAQDLADLDAMLGSIVIEPPAVSPVASPES